jgi:cytochrome c-type biogenesis protein CcmH/NrfG
MSAKSSAAAPAPRATAAVAAVVEAPASPKAAAPAAAPVAEQATAAAATTAAAPPSPAPETAPQTAPSATAVETATAPAETAAASAAPPADTKDEPVTGDAKEEKSKARSFLEKRKIADAIEAGERSVKLDPSDGESWLLLGAAYQEKGNMVEARRAYASCVKEAKTGPRNECAKMLR